jgi:transglutaminase-like putative cysteine protease
VSERLRRRLEAAFLALHLLASAAAFALSRGAPVAWLLLVPATLGFVAPKLQRRRLGRAVDYGCWILAALVFLLALVWSIYPLLPDATMLRLASTLGTALVFAAAFALAGDEAARPGRNLFPATLGLLALTSLPPAGGRAILAAVVVAALGVTGYLVVQGGGSVRLGRLASLAAFAAGSGVVALAIVRFLPWAQPHVEAATARLVTPPASTHYAGLSFSSRLGDIEEIALSRREVMRVFTGYPQRLRARVFTHFDGRAWRVEPAMHSADLEAVPHSGRSREDGWLERVPGTLLRVPGLPPPSAATVQTKIVQAVFNGGALVAPVAPTLIRLPSRGARIDSYGILTPSPSAELELYAIENEPGSPQLAFEDEDASALGLPADLDPRVAALAARLSAAAASPEERVAETLRFLARGYRYSLRVGRFESRQPVAEFLFEKKRGYCEYFATAAALLLRLQGLPTRYVTGFNVRDDSSQGGHYLVRESDAHAWIDVRLPGRGFVEVDPTPAAQYAELHRRSDGALARFLESLRALAAEAAARVRGGGLWAGCSWLLRALRAPLLAVFGAVGVALLLRVLRKRAWGRRPPAGHASHVPPPLGALVASVEVEWRRRGHARPAHRALREHLERIPQQELSPAWRSASAAVIDCFYRARFGSTTVAGGEIAELRRRLEEAASS